MADRPILFSAPMVRALLAGTKTQTRRLLKAKPHWERIPASATWRFTSGYKTTKADPPWMEATIPTSYGATEILAITRVSARPGDRLWVRETACDLSEYLDAPLFRDCASPFAYRADGDKIGCHHWRPSIFMPRRMSRLTLTVTDVCVQRLQDISEEDAIAEGIGQTDFWRDDHPPSICYSVLWDSINGAGSWAANPWVVAYSFTVAQRNIDAES